MATTQTTTVASKKFNLDWRDLGNGLLMAVYGAVGSQVYALIMAWATEVNYKFDKNALILLAKGAGLAAAAYLFKKFIDPSKIIVVNPPKEDVAAIKSGSAEVTVKPVK